MLRRLLLLNYTFVDRVDRWFKRRFTRAGLLVLGGLGAGGVFGIDLTQTSSYQLFTLAAALLVLSCASAVFFRPRLSARRRVPPHATVGQPLVYSVAITNHGRAVGPGLRLCEVVAGPVAGGGGSHRGRRPPLPFAFSYPRWVWLTRRAEGAVPAEVALPRIAGGETVVVDMMLTPLRRGTVRLGGLEVARPDPFGLFNALGRVGGGDTVLALPRRYPVRWAERHRSSPSEVGGTRGTHAAGDSDEFATVREYRPGDPLRHIHWRSWARLGQPIVKEFEDPCYVRHALVLDTFGVRSGDERFEEAVSVAASFVAGTTGQHTRLDLMFLGASLVRVSAGRGISAVVRLLEALAGVDGSPDRAFGALGERVLAEAPGLSACVCVLLDWDEERQSLVRRLQAMGIPVLVLVVLDAGDVAVRPPGPMAAEPQRLRMFRAGRAREALQALSGAELAAPTDAPAAGAPR